MFNIWEKTSKIFSPSPDSAVLKVWGRNLTKTCSKLRTHFKSIVLKFVVTIFFSTPSNPYRPVIFVMCLWINKDHISMTINNTLKTGICLILCIVICNWFWILLIILKKVGFQRQGHFPGLIPAQPRGYAGTLSKCPETTKPKPSGSENPYSLPNN